MRHRASQRQRYSIVVIAVAVLGLLQSATGQLQYATNNGAITITGYTGSGPGVTIPATFNGFPVTTIGSAAFYRNTGVTSVTIPGSVTNIGTFAFSASGLTGITIPNSVIGIAQYAFELCNSLTNISVNAGNPAYSSVNGVLFDKAKDTLIQYPDGLTSYNYAIPAGVTTIGYEAFYVASGVSSVTIPGSVTTIASDAFDDCVALKTVYFAGNAPSVGSFAFYQTGFGSGVTVNYLPGTTGWATFNAALGPSLAGSMLWYQPAPEILYTGFHSNQFGFTISWATNATVLVTACSNLANPMWQPISTTTVTATNGTANFTDPQSSSFRSRFYRLILFEPTPFTYTVNNGAITITGYTNSSASITIPATINGYPVVAIGSSAFANSNSLTSVSLPNSITNIGNLAFANSGLTEIVIPASVIGIGQQAFASCSSLTNISVSAGNPAYSGLNGVLFDKAQDTLIQFPNGLTMENYDVPGTVVTLSDYAFYGADGIDNVTIPSGVTSIGNDTFAYCAFLNSVYFGGNAPNVGYFAFIETGLGGGVTANYLPGTTGWSAFSAALGQWLAGSTFWYLPGPESLYFEPNFGMHNNKFGFTISWATNATIIVDAATNLANPVWLPISTNTVTANIGTTNFSDPKSGSYPKRFYRLRSP